jgi:hypothetical protein
MHPKHLYRDDGERFTKNDNGFYTMDSSNMAVPYQWSYLTLISTGRFSTSPDGDMVWLPKDTLIYKQGDNTQYALDSGVWVRKVKETPKDEPRERGY